MEFENAEEHLREALATSGADADYTGRGGVVARALRDRVGRPRGEAAADALTTLAQELGPLDAERSLELSCRAVDSQRASCSGLRSDLAAELERFRDRRRGHPGFEAVGADLQRSGTAVPGGAGRRRGERDVGGTRDRASARDGEQRRSDWRW